MALKWLGIFYFLSFLFHAFNLVYNFAFVNFPGENFLTFEGYPGKLKYMTIWNYAFDVVYTALVAAHFLRTNNNNNNTASSYPSLKSVIDVLHASLYFPLGLLVCTLYWGMTAIDPGSVVTAAMRTIQPEWNNHAMHTLPFLLAVLDAVLVKHKYPSNRKGLSIVFLFVIAYLSVVLYLGLGPTRVWVYPVLQKLSKKWSELAMFMGGCALMFVFEYFAGKALTVAVWRERRIYAVHED